MKITRENIDNVNAVIKVLVEKQDYEKGVEENLKGYRQKASIPGFRPGKVPMGLIKRHFKKTVLAEEINKMLPQNLTRYLMDEKLQILGEPLASTEHQKPIDWEKDEEFEFAFDVGLVPDFAVPLSEEDKLKYFTIRVSDDMVDEQVEMITSQMGENIDADEVKEKSLVRGDFVELDEEGNPKEDGIKTDGVLLSAEFIKDEEVKKQFLAKQKGEVLTFNPVTAYENRHEVGHLLKISHEQADELNSAFHFTITEILDYKKPELNEELYKKIYGDDTTIKTVEDLRNKLKEEIANSLLQSSDHRFASDTRDALLEKANFELPETFLKRWLKNTNKDRTDEQIEKDFDGFIKNLRWQLIKNFIIKENGLKAEDEEVFELAKDIAYAQYNQYGFYNAHEDQLEYLANKFLEKPEEKQKIYNKVLENKIINTIKGKVTLVNKEVTLEEFEKMAK